MERQEQARNRGSQDFLALADEVCDRLGVTFAERTTTTTTDQIAAA
jgi:hypothetical protein